MQTSKHHSTPVEPTSADYFKACLGQQFCAGNSIDILQNGQEIFPAMLKAIDEAQRHIEFLTFVYWQGEIAVEFARRLSAAAKRGVKVRVLLDSFGAHSIAPEAHKLLAEHCHLCWFRRMLKLRFWKNFKRTHRKILICDGQVGFTGGVGIAEQWSGDADSPEHWRDTQFAIRGPAVSHLQAAFAENWIEACCDDMDLFDTMAATRQQQTGNQRIIVVASTASDYWSPAGTLLLAAIASARKRLCITTPYLYRMTTCNKK